MQRRLGDTTHGAFLAELINNCVRDVPGGLVVDMNLLVQMCRAEPKSAQVALQWAATELTNLLDGHAVSAAAGDAQSMRLLTGSIYLAYCASRGCTDTPPEIDFILARYPVILASTDYVIANQPPDL